MKLGVLVEVLGLGLWGGGKESYESDVVLAKTLLPDGREVPVIPGAYFKGLLRSWAYRISHTIDKNMRPLQCAVFMTCGECIVCKVFGASGAPLPPTTITNFYPVRSVEAAKKAYKVGLEEALSSELNLFIEPQVVYVTRVGILDSTQTRSHGKLYTCEHIAPGTLFYGEIVFKEHLVKRYSPQQTCTLMLRALEQLNYSYIGRRTRAKIMLVGYSPKPLPGSADDIARKLLLGEGER